MCRNRLEANPRNIAGPRSRYVINLKEKWRIFEHCRTRGGTDGHNVIGAGRGKCGGADTRAARYYDTEKLQDTVQSTAIEQSRFPKLVASTNYNRVGSATVHKSVCVSFILQLTAYLSEPAPGNCFRCSFPISMRTIVKIFLFSHRTCYSIINFVKSGSVS
jgi:hypothetical protein